MLGTFYEERPELKERTMLLDDRGAIATYGDLDEFSRRTAGRMKSRSLLFILCGNSIGSVFTCFAALRNRVVPRLLNRQIMEDKARREMLGELMEEYRPKYLALPEEVYSANPDYFAGMPPVWHEWGYICLSCRPCSESSREVKLYEELALLLTTSGSTGSPKLVRLSYKNLSSNAASIASYLELTRSERPVTTLPMNYTYGLSVINSHALAGAAVLLTEKTVFDREFWEFASAEKATSLAGVPYTYEMLKKLKFMEMELPNLKTMTQAGGKLSVSLHREFAEYAAGHGKRFIVMYGQTEATARMGYLPASEALNRCGSMGIAIPGGKFRLTGEDGREIKEAGTTGELVYEGKNVMLGYAKNRSDLSKGDECRGILFTGDMARRDEAGFYYIEGRKKRFLKLFGNRISLDGTERLLKHHFGGCDFACTGNDEGMKIFMAMPKESMGSPGHCALPKPEETALFLEKATKLSRRVFEVITVGEIPKNDAGKVLYKKLEELP